MESTVPVPHLPRKLDTLGAELSNFFGVHMIPYRTESVDIFMLMNSTTKSTPKSCRATEVGPSWGFLPLSCPCFAARASPGPGRRVRVLGLGFKVLPKTLNPKTPNPKPLNP